METIEISEQNLKTPQNLSKKENPLVSLLLNVVAPYYILTKLSSYLGENGPTIALILALAFPVLYGAYDFFKNSRTNYISVFGVINTLFTGGFALLRLDGLWFIIKDGAFPLALGLFVYYTGFTDKPFIKYMFSFSQAIDEDIVQTKLSERQTTTDYEKLIQSSNKLLSYSFFISSILNFIISSFIFKKIDPTLSHNQFSEILNKQIADMTWMGYAFIAFPLMFFMMYIMFRFFKGLKALTGLTMEEIFPSMK